MKKIFSIVMLSGILLALVGCTSTTTSKEKLVSKDGVICDSCGQSLRGVDAGYSDNDPKF
ncbi:hypothetical protein [Cetobacterium sp.]|uniref:hypothetical protein n=1 Tax=Cetobacterium sp. TaxID=2071632 RepID=UPI002FC6F377